MPASALTVTLNGYDVSSVTTRANDLVDDFAFETLNPGAVPYLDTSSAVDGAASSTSEYSLTESGFTITFEHARTPTHLSLAQSFGSIYFSVDQDVPFTVAGAYTAADPDGRRMYLESILEDYTAGEYIYDSWQQSYSTVNERFKLGGNGGDHDNRLTGSLTGTLIAGHDYRFDYQASIQAYPTGSTTGATASGSVSLYFAALPEPSTGALMLLGLAFAFLRHSERVGTPA